MRPMYNLIDQPWIPCLVMDGGAEELGLRATLLRAREIRGLHGESPLVVASLYRLLLAVLHRVVAGPRGVNDWEDLWLNGWDEGAVSGYLDKWRDRFYLFHPEHPFYQWRDKNSREKSIANLFPEISSGTNATLFDHNTEATVNEISLAQAARALLLVQTTSIAGGSGMAPKDSSDAPWGRGIVFLAEGDDLFQTLMLNLMPYTSASPIPNTPSDRPNWEVDNPLTPQRNKPMGYLDYLTWLNRSIELVPGETLGKIVVRQVRMAPGLRLDSDLIDPFKHYRIDEKGGYKFLRWNENRALWRDSASLLRFQDAKNIRPPLTLRWLAELVDEMILDRTQTFRFMALGMSNNQAKIDFYSEEHLPIPGFYLLNLELVEALSQALEAAENVRRALYGSLSRLASLLLSPTSDDADGRKPDKKDVQNLIGHWAVDRRYWAELEVPFFHLLEKLPQDNEATLEEWDTILQRTARQALAQAESLAGDDARALRAAVRARGQLAGSLKKLFTNAG